MKSLRFVKYRAIRISLLSLIIVGGVLLFALRPQNDCKDCNLVLISIDTLRADHMGVYGYKRDTTPNIDKWAKNAIVFTNMRTIIPATLPSFSILMTGKNPFTSKIFNNFGTKFNGKLLNGGHPIAENTTTLSELLRKSGYNTGAYVTNESLNPKLTNIDKGFKEFNFLSGDWDKKKYITFFKQAHSWIENNRNNKFFLWLHFMSPHAPYTPPADYECKFAGTNCEEIKTKGVWEIEKERKIYEGCDDKGKVNTTRIPMFESLYDAEISFDDRLISEFLKQIDDMNLNKKTIVVIYGDHGEGLDHAYYFIHSQMLYNSSTRIPFIIKTPDNTGVRIPNLLDNTHIFGIIQDLLGIGNKPFTLDKKTITEKVSYLKNDLIFSVNTNLSKYSVEDNNYRFIYSIKGSSCLYNNYEEELYNRKTDPEENFNLNNLEQNIKLKYKTLLFSYLKKYDLPKPIKWFVDDSELDKEQQGIIEKIKSLGY